METVTDFIFLGPKSLQMVKLKDAFEIKRCFILGRKTMANLDSVLNSRDITLVRKVHVVKAMVFSAVLYGSENWTIKKAQH